MLVPQGLQVALSLIVCLADILGVLAQLGHMHSIGYGRDELLILVRGHSNGEVSIFITFLCPIASVLRVG